MTELLIIRHGETDWNRQHRFQGQIDVPLNAMGQQQATLLSIALMDEPIEVLVASDLQRARSTAEALASTGSLPRTLTLHIEPLWREQSFGILEGLDIDTIQRQHPELWAQWICHDADYALPEGGESNCHFFERTQQALAALLARHAGQRVAVVTHGGVLDMLWRRVHALPLSGPRECDIPYTGINRLRWADDRLHIVRWADAAHLHGLPEQPSTAQSSKGLQQI